MILIVLASMATGVLGYVYARKMSFQRIFHCFCLEFKYHVVALQAIFLDHLQRRYNKIELTKMSGRVAIVTGGSRGIGLQVVRMLLKCNMEVIIACRTKSQGEKAVVDMRNSGIETGKTNVMILDNADLNSVRKFVEEFTNTYDKLDILINSAGIMFPPYKETKDGFEQQYGVNYLSHFLLTILLIPVLKKTGTSECGSRVVNVSSCANIIGKIHFDDVNLKQYFLTGEAYAQSKFAQLLFTKYLARFLKEKDLPIKTYAVHPGIVNTDLFENTFHKYFRFLGRLLFKSPEEGATPIVYAAISPKIENKSGMYISNCLEGPVNSLADDIVLQDLLFDLSLSQVNLKTVTT